MATFRPPSPRRPATTSPAGPAPITMTSNSRRLMPWHPDGMGRFVAVPLLAAFVVASACGGSKGSASVTSAGTPATTDGGGASRALHLAKVGTFDSPLYVISPPGDARRLMVVEQGGTIRVVRGGKKLAQPFLDIRSRVVSGGEQGLLSMAFARNYARSHRLWVYFTNRNGDEEIDAFRAASADRADPGSAKRILIQADTESNHNGGQLQMGSDGYLYAGLGDGGGENDQHGERGNGQNLGTLLGKIIRITPRAGGGYSIPKSNPFVGRAGARGAIYSYGLRNPWRFSFDRRTGDIVIGDVGQNAVEEIDSRRRGTAKGVNFGWRPWEGRRRNFNEPAPGAVFPQLTKTHSDGWCSITGGYIVRDRSLGSLYGRYVYGDFCKGQLRSVKLSQSRASGDSALPLKRVPSISSFGEDERGRVYVVSLDGPVYRFAR
ncbi:MAG: PQQ-dependent sugar dehydrogenase [Actinobacteria bacterium]|nr:MAG: PQQ-dependent sugar dehydrogenase [Actinomycetota bacterium]